MHTWRTQKAWRTSAKPDLCCCAAVQGKTLGFVHSFVGIIGVLHTYISLLVANHCGMCTSLEQTFSVQYLGRLNHRH